MKLTDRRLYQARNLEDFAFRYWFRDEDNRRRRNATRETALLAGEGFIAPDTNKIWGVDISHWDGNVNLSVTKDFGGDFVIIKAMDGTIPTRYWKENTARAIAAGLPNSSYAWLYPDNRINCTLQAQAYYSLIKDTPHSFPPIVDFEWTRYAGVQANPNYEDLRKWTAAFTRLSGTKPILYSAAGYMNMFGRMPDDLRAMFSGFHFASYGGLTLPTGFSSWDIHQFTASGDALALCPGDTNKKELDLNYMTEAFYRQYIGGITEPPTTEPPTEPGDAMIGKVLLNLNIRPTPGVSLPAIGQLAPNDIVEASTEFSGWWKLTKWTRAGVVKPLPATDCYAYEGVSNGYIQEITPPEPEPIAIPEYLIAHFADGTERRYIPE
jgi:GH25 family lysozyme M1 (1,4-beta-N-acetylmuramidase)